MLARYLADPRGRTLVDVELPEGTVAGELAAQLGVPQQEVALLAVNNRRAERERVLHDGDRVTLFPPVAGG